MSEKMTEYWKTCGRWINRLRFKSTWKKYINGDMSYAVYKEMCFLLVNSIRKVMGSESFSFEKFDEAWQYRTLAHERYEIAREELKNVIFGWW